MDAKNAVARMFRMDDEAWRRHANPWSVWTRFAAIPPLQVFVDAGLDMPPHRLVV
jgi:hypothetical protein